MFPRHVLLALSISSTLALVGHTREWTDANGVRKVEAEFVRLTDDTVSVKLPSGTVKSVQIAKLSQADQVFARRSAATEPASVDSAGPKKSLIECYSSVVMSVNHFPPSESDTREIDDAQTDRAAGRYKWKSDAYAEGLTNEQFHTDAELEPLIINDNASNKWTGKIARIQHGDGTGAISDYVELTDLPWSRVSISINPQLRIDPFPGLALKVACTKYAGLWFAVQSRLNIGEDFTVFADQPGVVAFDDNGGVWVSRRVISKGEPIIAFFRDDTAAETAQLIREDIDKDTSVPPERRDIVATNRLLKTLADAPWLVQTTASQEFGGPLLPSFYDELRDRFDMVNGHLRVVNPNDSDLIVGVRSGNSGMNFGVRSGSQVSRLMPDGWYDLYVVFTNRPNELFQGNSVHVADGVREITIREDIFANRRRK